MPKNRIHRANDGRYTYTAYDNAGKRRQLKSRKNETKTAFSKRCDDLDRTISITSGSTSLTFDDLFSMYADNHLANLSVAHAKNTINLYRNMVQPMFGHRTLEKITPKLVYDFLQDKIRDGHSKSYVSKIRVCLSAPFNFGKRSGICTVNPCSDIVLTFNKKNIKENPNQAISDDDLRRFFAVSGRSKYHNYFALLAETGLRPSEALGLKWTDVDGDRLHVQRAITKYEQSRGKTDRANRIVPLSDNAVRILRNQSNNSIWIFPTATESGYPNMESVVSAFKIIRRGTCVLSDDGSVVQPPVDFTLYGFRHTFATKCVQSGMIPSTLQYIMGHESIEITLKYYVSVQDDDLKKAADIISSFNPFIDSATNNATASNSEPPESFI